MFIKASNIPRYFLHHVTSAPVDKMLWWFLATCF